MQQTSEIYKELLEAQQLGDPSVKFQTRLTIGEPGVLITKQGDSITFGSKAYTKTAAGSTIVLTETEDRPLAGLKVIGKTTQNGTPTPDAPVPLETVGTDGSVAVKVCGKNLLENTGSTTSINGVTFTVNDDGSVTANGTATANTFFNVNLAVQIEEGKKYILSGCPSHTGLALYGGAYGADTGSGMTFTGFTTASSGLAPNVYIRIASGTTVNNVVVKPMIRLASNTDSTYEPYKGGSVSVSTPNGLPGIPVASGGNYTDESGKQWLCDEVDFEKGVYVQRVEKRVFTGTEAFRVHASGRYYLDIANGRFDITDTWGLFSNDVSREGGTQFGSSGVYFKTAHSTVDEFKAYLADNYASGQPITAQIVLRTFTETALSAEQLAAFTALRTYQPNTTVFNDSGACTEIKYTMNGDGPSRILTGVSGADSGYDETVLISMETDARVFSEDTPEVGASISSQIDIEMIKPFAELPKQARLVPYVRLSDGLRHSEWIQKGVYYIDTRSKVEDGSSIEKIVLHGYDDMLKAEQDYPESALSWPAKDLDVVREIAEFIGVAVDDRTVSIMNRGYTIQYPTGYSCRDVLGYIAAMYAGSFIMSDLGDLRLVTIYGIPKETRYLIEPNGYVITFGGDRILV